MAQENTLSLYNRVREVPPEAKKEIQAGRLKGKTDINPLWRIQTLTREFGPAGIGWYTETERWVEDHGNERALFIHIKLYIRDEHTGDWSAPIEGYGGAMILSQEKSGLFFDDDAAKKAYTDAISQACRSLGIGADVYWANDATKYQQEKALAESREQAIEYLQSLTTAEQMKDAWDYYNPYFGKDKDFKTAFAKRQQEIANGTKA